MSVNIMAASCRRSSGTTSPELDKKVSFNEILCGYTLISHTQPTNYGHYLDYVEYSNVHGLLSDAVHGSGYASFRKGVYSEVRNLFIARRFELSSELRRLGRPIGERIEEVLRDWHLTRITLRT
jgi:hypothetical protein